jgi:hypothetical protein
MSVGRDYMDVNIACCDKAAEVMMLLDRLPLGDLLILLTCDFSTTDTMLLDHILLTRFKVFR